MFHGKLFLSGVVSSGVKPYTDQPPTRHPNEVDAAKSAADRDGMLSIIVE
jgi:hypothetical protein